MVCSCKNSNDYEIEEDYYEPQNSSNRQINTQMTQSNYNRQGVDNQAFKFSPLTNFDKPKYLENYKNASKLPGYEEYRFRTPESGKMMFV